MFEYCQITFDKDGYAIASNGAEEIDRDKTLIVLFNRLGQQGWVFIESQIIETMSLNGVMLPKHCYIFIRSASNKHLQRTEAAGSNPQG